jgi:hypothetical protein
VNGRRGKRRKQLPGDLNGDKRILEIERGNGPVVIQAAIRVCIYIYIYIYTHTYIYIYREREREMKVCTVSFCTNCIFRLVVTCRGK